MGDTVLYEAADAVATLTLNRPERCNAITPELIDDFDAALARALADDEVRVVRLRGAGQRVLRGLRHRLGLESMQEAEAGAPWDPIADYQTMRRFVDAYMALWRSPKPVVAQVHGYCVAGGTDFALCSDLIVCAEDCRIGYPPARVWGSPTTAMWMYRLGLERSKRLLLTGDAIDGAPRGAVGAGFRGGARGRARGGGTGARAAAWRCCPHNQAADEAAGQPGLRADGPAHARSSIGTLLDGAARHTPEGTAFTQRALADVRGARGRPRRALRRLRPGARDGVARWRGAAASGWCSPAAAAGASAATRRWSSSRAGRCCTTRCDVLRAVLDEVAVVAKQSTLAAEPRRRDRDLARGRGASPSAGRASSTPCAARAGGRSSWWPADMPFVTRGARRGAGARERSRGAAGGGAARGGPPAAAVRALRAARR